MMYRRWLGDRALLALCPFPLWSLPVRGERFIIPGYGQYTYTYTRRTMMTTTISSLPAIAPTSGYYKQQALLFSSYYPPPRPRPSFFPSFFPSSSTTTTASFPRPRAFSLGPKVVPPHVPFTKNTSHSARPRIPPPSPMSAPPDHHQPQPQPHHSHSSSSPISPRTPRTPLTPLTPLPPLPHRLVDDAIPARHAYVRLVRSDGTHEVTSASRALHEASALGQHLVLVSEMISKIKPSIKPSSSSSSGDEAAAERPRATAVCKVGRDMG